MTSQYTSNILNNILSAANNQTGAKTSANSFNTETSEQFAGFLNNSMKSYADKSQQKSVQNNYNNPSYAKNTKDVQKAQTAVQSDSSQNKKTDNNKNSSVKNKAEENAFKTSERKTDNTKNESSKIDNSKQEKIKDKSENKTKEETTSSEKQTQDVVEKKPQETEQTEQENAAQTLAQNTVLLAAANESILANINFEEVAITTPAAETTAEITTETTVESTKTTAQKNAPQTTETQIPVETVSKTTEDAIKTAAASVIENIESLKTAPAKQVAVQDLTAEKNTVATISDLQQTAKQPVTKESKINLTAQVTPETADLQVDVQSTQKPSTEATEVQNGTKAALNADNSRIILNLDNTETAQETTTQATAVTPADTEPEKAPVIKVTQEVAANVKETATNGFIENKDVTSKAKSKAASQMTSLENTDTVVTQGQSTFDAKTQTQGQTNGQTNSQTGQGSEQVAKMSVESVQQPTSGSEAFINRLDKTFASQVMGKGSSAMQPQQLNQSDIMNQINAKLEEMQTSGNNKVSIVLKPENLGRVSLEIMNSKEGIVAKMTTDSQQVKELFDKNVEALKSNLSSQGVNVNNIKVECTHESSNNSMNFEREQFNQNASRDPNGQRQTSQNGQNSERYTGSDYSQDSEIEFAQATELKNTETIIQHNGKVDYKV